jgi:hypothetical protein
MLSSMFRFAIVAVLLLLPRATTSALNMQLVDRIAAGDVQSVVVSGNHAFVAGSDVFYVVDIADPTDPEVLSYVESDGRASHLVLDGDLLYLAAVGAGVEIYDVSVPTSPRRISQVPISGWGLRMDLQPGRLFVAAHDQGLVIVDVSDPENPYVQSQYSEPLLDISDVHVEGNAAYCGAGIFELDIYIGYVYTFDVSGTWPIPTTPPQQPPLSFQLPERVFYAGIIAYVAFGASTERIIVPVSVPLAAWPFAARSFDLLGTDLVMTDFVGVRVYRGEDEISLLELPGGADDAFLTGQTLYRAAGQWGFQIVDLVNPNEPVHVGGYDGPSDLDEIIATSDVVYTGGRDQLYVIDVSQPRSSVTMSIPGLVLDLLLDGQGLLYVSRNGILEIYDLADPLLPSLLSSLDVGWTREMSLSGLRLYVMDSRAHVLRVLDATRPRAGLTSLGSYALATRPTHVAASGSTVYVGDQYNTLSILDASDPAMIELQNSQYIPSIRDLQVVGDRLYIGTGASVQIHSLADPFAPTLLGEAPGNTWSMHVAENLLTLCEAVTDEILVYDVSSPDMPVLVAQHDLIPTVSELSRVGNRIHVAGNNVGYFQFELDGAATATRQSEPASLMMGSRPNPARGWTEIFLLGDADGRVEVGLYDVAGRLVRHWEPTARAGEGIRLTWDGRDLRSRPVSRGVYFLRARSATGEAHHRITWIR